MAATSTGDDIRTEPAAMDYLSHRRQFERFLHLLKWFVVHILLMLPALYFLLVAGQGIAGTSFLLLSLAALAYGVVTTGGVGRDIEAAIESAGHSGRARR